MSEEKNSKNERMIDDKIKNRNNILKIIIISVFSILVAVKLLISDISLDLSKFDFSDFLTLILALFSIGLSIAFFFKATDTSNNFYDNTYKFTKEVSEILGRIEAGFGERLRHLDEGYSGLASKFDNGFSEQNKKDTEAEIKKEQQKLKQETLERNEIINSLIEKAQLEKEDQEKIRQQLKEKELEISKQNREINFLKIQLDNQDENSEIEPTNPFVSFLLKQYIRKHSPETFVRLPASTISRKYPMDINNNGFPTFVTHNIVNEDGTFTLYGIRLLKQIAKSML